MEIQAERVERYCEIRARSGAQVSRNLECCPAHLTPCRNGRGLTVESKFWKWTVVLRMTHSRGRKGEVNSQRRSESQRRVNSATALSLCFPSPVSGWLEYSCGYWLMPHWQTRSWAVGDSPALWFSGWKFVAICCEFSFFSWRSTERNVRVVATMSTTHCVPSGS